MSFLLIYKIAYHYNKGDRKGTRADVEHLLNVRLGIK
jgi:hypothetical protein